MDTKYKIALLSNSQIKANALFNVLERKFKDLIHIHGWDSKTYSISLIEGKDKSNQIEQPIDLSGGYGAARNRFMVVLKEHPDLLKEYNLVVVMENYMDSKGVDLVMIILYDVRTELEYHLAHPCARVPTDYNDLFKHVLNKRTHKWGSPVTFGSLLNETNKEISANDWMSFVIGKKRQVALEEGLERMFDKFTADVLSKKNLQQEGFKTFPDFPKKGVAFQDWSNIFLNHHLLSNMVDLIAKMFNGSGSGSTSVRTKHDFLLHEDITPHPKIDYIVGLESRGLWLAIPLALKMQCGMIPVRKPSKIPGPTLTESYQKEYGSDTIEIRNDLPPGNVLIVDDVLATGGSLMAAIKLVERAGHNVIGCTVVSDVPELREQAQSLLSNYSIHVLLK